MVESEVFGTWAPYVLSGVALGALLGLLSRWLWRLSGLASVVLILAAVAFAPRDPLSASTWLLLAAFLVGGAPFGFVPVAYAGWLSRKVREAELEGLLERAEGR